MFHSRAVEFYKSASTAFVFFGTLCTRPAAKSKISARASRLCEERPNEDSHPERRRLLSSKSKDLSFGGGYIRMN